MQNEDEMSGLGHLPGQQKVCGSSPTMAHLFLVLPHTIRRTACPLALYILELTRLKKGDPAHLYRTLRFFMS
jgi:hypothetical protein